MSGINTKCSLLLPDCLDTLGGNFKVFRCLSRYKTPFLTLVSLISLMISSQRSVRRIVQLSRREFLIFNLAHQDENFCHLISCFETRPRIISFPSINRCRVTAAVTQALSPESRTMENDIGQSENFPNENFPSS